MPASSKIQPNTSVGIQTCAELLRANKLVAVPTETVYGLAGNALSEEAVRKIFEVKGRPLIDPLISHFSDAVAAFAHLETSPEALLLAQVFWPGPLTLVLPKKATIPDIVTAGLPSAAVRVPLHPVLRALLQELPFPLAAPSANPFGYVSPTKPEHVLRTLGTEIDAILDGGSCEHGLESTVLDLRQSKEPKLLRPGPVQISQIESVLNLPVIKGSRVGSATVAQSSPGQLTKHYSPNACIKIIDNGATDYSPEPEEALILNARPSRVESEQIYWLSEDSNIETIARNLFDLMQRIDQKGASTIVIEAAPEEGIGLAFNDRIRRAAAR
jgi:L-threonylcarbamoyladenylate synthase